MTATMTGELVARRRAVEALRSGVPSWDAVAVLGSGQQAAEDQFSALLDRVHEGGLRAGRLGCCSAAASAPGRATCSLISAIWPWRRSLS